MNFRNFETSSGKLVLAGKDAKNNEELIKQIEQEDNAQEAELLGLNENKSTFSFVIAGIIIIILLAFFYRRRRRKKKNAN